MVFHDLLSGWMSHGGDLPLCDMASHVIMAFLILELLILPESLT